MTVNGARLLSALKIRLEKITAGNGYPLTVSQVITGEGEIMMEIPADRCPLIEIVDGDEWPEKIDTGGHMQHVTQIYLRMVQPKAKTDLEMQEFHSAIIRCIYGDSYTGSANSGVRLTDYDNASVVVKPKWIRTKKDYNLIPSNRIWVQEWEFSSVRWPYSF